MLKADLFQLEGLLEQSFGRGLRSDWDVWDDDSTFLEVVSFLISFLGFSGLSERRDFTTHFKFCPL